MVRAPKCFKVAWERSPTIQLIVSKKQFSIEGAESINTAVVCGGHEVVLGLGPTASLPLSSAPASAPHLLQLWSRT